MEKKSLVKNSIYNMAYNLLNLLFPLITSMHVSRALRPASLGVVEYAQNLTSYFIVLSTLGLSTYGVREIAKTRDDQESTNRLFTELFLINLCTTGIATAAFLLTIFSGVLSVNRNLMLCCGLQLFLNFANIDWLYQGLEEYVYIVRRSVTIKILSVLAILFLVKDTDDYMVYALITSMALAGNYIFNIIHSRKYVHFRFQNLKFLRHLQPLIYLGLAIFFSAFYSKTDITMLGLFSQSSEIGIYSNSLKIVNIILGICASLSAVFLPRLSYYYSFDRKYFQELLNLGVGCLSFIVFPMCMGLSILAPQIVQIMYGKEFAGCAEIIQIMAVLLLIKGFGDLLCYQVAVATANERTRLLSFALAALSNVVLNYFLIPVLGGKGAAIATVVSELILNLFLFIQMKLLVGYRLKLSPVFQGIFASLVMGGCMLPAIRLVSGDPLILTVGFLTGSAVYLLLNVLMKNQFLYLIINKLRHRDQSEFL